MTTTLGVTFYAYLGLTYSACVELAKMAEDQGFDGVFVVETFTTDAMAAVEAIALATRHITVGPGIANVYFRHPAFLGAGALAIDELSGGRLILGIGVGQEHAVKPLGIAWREPRAVLRETTDMLRKVFAGDRLPGASRPFQPARRPIPIHLAGLALETAELAGEIADGLMLYVATPDRYRAAVERMARGAAKAGRRAEDVSVSLLIPTFLSDDHAAAREAARRFLANYLPIPFYNNAFRRSGFTAEIEAFNDAMVRGNRQEAAARLSDRLMDAVCLIGPPSRCRERLAAFREAGVAYPILAAQTVDEPFAEGVRRVLRELAKD